MSAKEHDMPPARRARAQDDNVALSVAPLVAVRPTATVSPAGNIPQAAHPVWQQLVLGGISTGAATCVTHPIDTCKARIQMHPATSATSSVSLSTPPSLSQLFVSVLRSDNPSSLFHGLPAALVRVATYSAVRVGLYEPFKDALSPPGQDGCNSLGVKLCAGLLSGGVAAVIGNPFELMKVRMQTNKGRDSNPGSSGSVPQALRSIVRCEGVFALWRGVVPAVVRSSLLTALQLTVYSETKVRLKEGCGLRDADVSLHLGAGTFSRVTHL
jgi:hypothetical protein